MPFQNSEERVGNGLKDVWGLCGDCVGEIKWGDVFKNCTCR